MGTRTSPIALASLLMTLTALTPDGSGDYTVELGALSVPLSRRFPEALAKLRAG